MSIWDTDYEQACQSLPFTLSEDQALESWAYKCPDTSPCLALPPGLWARPLPAKPQVKMHKEVSVGWKWRKCGPRPQDLGHHPDSATCQLIYEATTNRRTKTSKCRVQGRPCKTQLQSVSPTSSPSCSLTSTLAPFCPSTLPHPHTYTIGSKSIKV